ncbi:DUF2955 domain-containing protein [Aeromonas caviae]|uniref:DUF2955 domain-containing protein n=2 Tax=Aeromonadaceae TaxID=84642 RepID=UPI0004D591AD|nr:MULTISPECIES: DUF2955 domain-containing protein [Aeromonas]KDV01738.1 hypothetical protein AW15_18850 [Aeromonas sp. HZM]MBL0576271.1 DUF2955 domain-containing protein [Aeromonas caviae]MDX7806781.1 DUF2955 domain-containing protein [Aeromonas caviae]MDX7858845.1 DUF2955 domain-containing protein [Aeromonas caviae]RQM52740.1 DUF2955 domain-containing protein [Aeromonas caviae]
MHNADKAVLRIGTGIGLATGICYGLALPMPHLGVIMAWVVLCRPGEPLSLGKGLLGGALLLAVMVGGVLLVPLLTHYALAAVLLVALLLYLLMQQAMAGKGAAAMLLIMAITVIPVAGLIEQSLAIALAQMMGLGILIGTLVNRLAHALFPPLQVAGAAARPVPLPPEHPERLALRAVAMVLPMWLLALGNPAFYIPAVMKTVTLAQQSTSLNARQAGQELVLSTLMGALLAFALWLGLSLWPSLLMLVLILALMTLWLARRLVRLVAGRFPPSFWSNAWITALILFGPAIEDSATGKDVWLAAAMRCGLYLVVAGYGWLCILLLEQWCPVGRPLAEAKLGD